MQRSLLGTLRQELPDEASAQLNMSITTIDARPRASEPLRDLVARVDLRDLVERYSGPGRASGSTTTYRCPNPEHQDNHPSFSVKPTRTGRQIGRCFSQCNWHGDALALVQWLEGISSVAEAATWLREWLGEHPEHRAPRAPKPSSSPVRPRELTDSSPRPNPERTEWLLSKYLEKRGWPGSVVDRFGLSVVLDETGAERIRHPYYAPSSSGRWTVAYWQDRGTRGSRIRWLSPKGAAPIPHNLQSLEADGLSSVIITEGPADCITASVALQGLEHVAVIGIPGVSAWRSEWAQLLTGLSVVVAADNDEAGQRLEEAVRASLTHPVRIYRPSRGDLTDTALELGLGSLRVALLRALGDPNPTERSFELVLRMLLDAFPGSELLTEEGPQ